MKPILFNTDMVRAILDGRKTETRRPMKPQPLFYTGRKYIMPDDAPKKWHDSDDIFADCAPCQPGDILYVRETWSAEPEYYYLHKADCPIIWDDEEGGEKARIEASEIKWRPSIHMPKEAARLFLRVVEVRVERVLDISEEGARAEGFSPNGPFTSKAIFVDAWQGIYQNSSDNPWVWVIKFERTDPGEVA